MSELDSSAGAWWRGLGGFGALNDADIVDSAHFLRLLAKEGVGTSRALDCGSGIGRVTKLALLPAVQTVDMVDLAAAFVQQSKDYLGEELEGRVGQRWVTSLQDFTPPKATYDLVWLQWVTCYLSDPELLIFLNRSAKALVPGGAVVLKENLCSKTTHDFDPQDSFYSRDRDATVELGRQAGLELFAEMTQQGFPKEMLPVAMFAFRPAAQ